MRRAHSEGLAIRHGDVLEEAHDDNIDMGEYQHLIAATDNDSQNQLITADLGPEMGYEQISRLANDSQSKSRVGHGRLLFESGADFGTLLDRDLAGWRFSKTNITEKFTGEDYRKNLE